MNILNLYFILYNQFSTIVKIGLSIIDMMTESENQIKPIIEPPYTLPNHHHNLYNNIHSSTLNHSISRNNDHDEKLSSTSSVSWPNDVDVILERIRRNSIILSDYHKQNYFYLHSRLKYFRIPVIIISAFASVFNIGLQPFMDQGWISIICCLMSLVTGLIGSIELFLQIQKRMESDLTYSRDYYLLAIDIYKVLSLDPKNRNGDGGTFLDDKFNIYRKMVENSNILDKKIIDQLAPIDTRLTQYHEVGQGIEGHPPQTPTMETPNEIAKHMGVKSDSTDVHDHKHDKDKDMFHSYFWKPPHDNHETESIDTEDRFQIYCDLVQKSDYIEEGVLEKLTPILISHRKNQEYHLPMEDRMKLFCYFLDNSDKFNISNGFIDKMKPILMSDFFRSSDHTSNTNLGIEDKFKLYQTITRHQNVLDNSALDKIKHVLMNDIKKNSTNKKESNHSWIQSIGTMLHSKSSEQPTKKGPGIKESNVGSSTDFGFFRNIIKKNLVESDKILNQAPIHNLYDAEDTAVFVQGDKNEGSLQPSKEQYSIGRRPYEFVENQQEGSEIPRIFTDDFITKKGEVPKADVRRTEAFGSYAGNKVEAFKSVGVLKPLGGRPKSSQLYSINIPKNRQDEISFIQGNLEV